MRSLHDAHEMNAYSGWSCLSVRIIRQPLDWFGWNMVWTLCHWGLPKNRMFQFPTIGNTNMADEQTCEVGSTLMTLAIGPYTYEWWKSFGKYKTLENNSLYNVSKITTWRLHERKKLTTRIRSYDTLRRSPVRYHRVKVPYDVSVFVYVT
jgi:hypothetical protein